MAAETLHYTLNAIILLLAVGVGWFWGYWSGRIAALRRFKEHAKYLNDRKLNDVILLEEATLGK